MKNESPNSWLGLHFDEYKAAHMASDKYSVSRFYVL